MSRNENIKTENQSLTSKDKNFIYVIVFSFIIILFLVIDFQFQVNGLKKEIFNLKTFDVKSENVDTKIFESRLSNLESKYIDVLSSKDTINWWISILTLLIPVTLGLFVYQKGKLEEKAEKELERVEKMLEEAKIKVENLDKIAEDKIRKIANKTKEEMKEISLSINSGISWTQLFNKAYNFHIKGKIADAEIIYKEILKNQPNEFFTLYNLGCLSSLNNNKTESINYLDKVFDLGYFDKTEKRINFYNDKDFDNIKDSKEFKDFIKKLEDKYGKIT